jgi:hypothetical protein
MLFGRSILVKVLLRSVTEPSWCPWPIVLAGTQLHLGLPVCHVQQRPGRWPVAPVGLQTPWGHPFEPQCKRAFDETGPDEVVGLIQCRAPSRTVVVYIRDWDACQPESVQGSLRRLFRFRYLEHIASSHLTTARVSIAVSHISSLNSVVGDACIHMFRRPG